MRLKNTKRLRLEALEDRLAPASFTVMSNGTTLTLTQVGGAVGALTFTDDPATGDFTYDDAGDPPPVTLNVPGISNISITLLSGDATAVTYDLTSSRGGNITLGINNSLARTVTFDGGGNSVGGNLAVTGGNGALTFTEGTAVTVGGNATFTGGNASDTVNLGAAGTVVGGNLTLTKVNTVTFGASAADSVGGSVLFNATGDASNNTFTLNGTIGSNLNYTGGNGTEAVSLSATSVVGSSANVNLGTQTSGTSSFSQAAGGVIGTNLTLTGGNIATETATISGTVGGSLSLNLGSGTNTVTADGTFGGSSFSYFGGAGVDTVTYTPAAGSARLRFYATLGAANDSVTFGSGATNPSYAYVDFGAGTDTVSGTLNFPFTFLNLP